MPSEMEPEDFKDSGSAKNSFSSMNSVQEGYRRRVTEDAGDLFASGIICLILSPAGGQQDAKRTDSPSSLYRS